MIIVRKFILVCLPILLISPTVVRAQDEARAAWQVTNFDLAVSSLSAERALNTHAVVSLRNVGRGAGSSVSLRLNAKAEVKAVSISGVAAAYRATPEARGGAQRISVTLPGGVVPNAKVDVTVDYRLPVEDNSGLAAISPLSSQFLPLSLWYPQLNTPFAVRGADTAPFRLTVAGASAIASGVDKSTNGTDSVFDQSLSAMPFFVTGTWDRVEGGSNAKGINAYLMKGAGADERKRAEALMALAADARSFFMELLGPVPDIPIRLVAVARGGGFDDSGTVLLGTAAFRRSKIDAVTVLTIAEAVARLKISGEAGIHGEGYGVLREGLARFLAMLFFEKEFGAETAEGERGRERLAYIAVAKRDSPLSQTTQGDDTYFNSVSNKGAMVWRLLDHLVGREAFVAAVRTSLQNVKDDPNGFNLGRFRAVLAERGGASIKNVLDQQLDQPTDMDLMVGLPRMEGGQWISALRNLGSIDATVNVAAITDSGERVTVRGTISAHDFAQVVFKTAGKIVRVEVDPEKFYPQLDFANDVVPHSANFANGLGEATRLLGAQEYSKAEALAREMLSASPRMQEARIVLARTLLGANRNDEAEKEFRQLVDERLPTPAALAWADIGLGEIGLRRSQAAEAARRFNDAVREDAEYPSTLAARAARIRAESAANVAPAIDESAKMFIGQLDAAIRSGRKSDMDALVMPGELVRFLKGLAGTPSEVWDTRVLRTEQLDASRLAADVELHTKQLGVEHSGTAVLILARVGGGWKLNAIEYFEVR
jgi:tetratricopeptide (TPR) repeat protein